VFRVARRSWVLIQGWTARSQPTWIALSVLVNCEYRLYVLNQSTPLRNNPFLSHWVEAIQRLEMSTAERAPRSNGSLTSDDIFTVRVELIKALLQSRNPSQFAQTSPKKMYAEFVELRQKTPFDIRIYVRMLEEEEIYSRTPEPPDHQKNGSTNTTQGVSSKERDASRPGLNDFQQWKQDMLDKLETSPNTAIQELTHLPIELSSLDFLTTLLQEKALEKRDIYAPPLISNYMQHALRLTEKMGQPPDATSMPFIPSSENGELEQAVLSHGREAQTRAVKLLLLFIKNMIRKALLPIEAIYFEIQEICVRYVWIREVREFRAFIEEGAGGESLDR
jgi:hypothetical protein